MSPGKLLTSLSKGRALALSLFLFALAVRVYALTLSSDNLRFLILLASMGGLYAMYRFTRLLGERAVPSRPDFSQPLGKLAAVGRLGDERLADANQSGEWMASAVLAFASAAPWHIMQSRLALESNLFPHLLMTGLWLLYEGVGRKKKTAMLAAVIFLGLSICSFILFNVPLISGTLFFAENIPAQLAENIKALYTVVFLQRDSQPQNMLAMYGHIYHWAMPFTFCGAVYCFDKRTRFGAVCLLGWTAAALLFGIIVNGIDTVRINIIWYPLLIFTGVGMYKAAQLVTVKVTQSVEARLVGGRVSVAVWEKEDAKAKRLRALITAGIIVLVSCSFLGFAYEYFM